MKTHTAMAAVLTMILSTAVMAWQASPSESFMGEVSTVDAQGMTLTVKQATGESNTMTFQINAETTIEGTAPEEGSLSLSDLEAGDQVTVTYVEHEGSHLARMISVESEPST